MVFVSILSHMPAPHREHMMMCSVSIALTIFFWLHLGQKNTIFERLAACCFMQRYEEGYLIKFLS